MNPLWPHLLHFCWLALLPSLVQATLPPSFPPSSKSSHSSPGSVLSGGQTTLGEVYRMSPKLCKAESEASHLQISKERILSRSENIFKGSISVTEHQGQKWEIWAKASQEIISVPSHPFTKGLQLESPQVPLSLSPSLPSSLGMSPKGAEVRHPAPGTTQDLSQDHTGPALWPLEAGVEGECSHKANAKGRLCRVREHRGRNRKLHRGRNGQTASGRMSKLCQAEGPSGRWMKE